MRKISIKIYIFSLVLWQINVFSQNAVSVGPFKEEQPKNEEIILQNENVKIPLYTIKTGNIIYPIDLIYNIGGIAVDQVAEAIGLGWQLSDSYIYREVEDKIDVDEPNGGNYPTYSATGYEGHTNVMHSSTIQELKKKGYQNVKTNSITEHFNTNIGLLDHAPDIFNLNSLFFNTTFYFPDSKTSAKELYGNNTIISPEIGDILINYTDDKRQVYQGPLLANNRVFQDYKKFTIKQNNGIVSIFDEPDYVHIINFVRNTIGPNYGLYYPNKFDLYNSPTTEKWHLSSIIDPLTNRTVSFSYQTFSTEDDHINTFANFQNKNKPYLREGVFYKYNFNYAANTFITNDCYIYKDPGEQWNDSAGESNRVYKRYIKKKRLQKIVFDNGTIDFIYGLMRQDFHNDKALTRIEVRNKENKLIKSFDFAYDYFSSEQYRNEFSKRLKLTSITDIEGGRHSFEYYEDNKMPQIGSYNKDFYGYCNTSNDDIINSNDDSTINSPIYYYYPDKYEYSLLPYNIPNQKKLLIEGVVNKEPNNLAKTWSLKKIIYPTGGSISYNLETSTFNLWGQNLNGPGVRVASKSIATSTTSSAPKVIAYNYNLSNGNSSGSIYNFPLAGYPLKQLFSSYEDDYGVIHSAGSSYMGEPSLYKTFLLFQALSKSKATIKYSRVQQTEGNKKTVNEYETITNKSKRYFRNFYPNNGINDFGMHCISDFLFTNSGLGKDNTGFINTYLVSAKIYEGNIILAESIKKYKNNFTKELYTQPSPNNYCFHESFIRNSSTAFDVFPSWNYENLIIYDKHYFTRSNYLIESINTDYFPSGTNIKTTSYSYDSTIWGKDPIQSGTSITDNSGNFYLTQFIYPNETYTALLNANMLTTVIGEKKFKNNNEISNNEIIYDQNSTLPSGARQYSERQNYKINTTFDTYDNKGNLVSYKDSDGIYTTILYGYNQTLPIAIIKGTSYSGLAQELNFPTNDVSEYLNLEIVKKSNLDVNPSTENTLITELDNFRKQLNFGGSSYKITTYTYDTLIGVTSVTPPTGMTQKYIYNSVTNKLEKIVDKDDNILKEFKYNYKH